MKDILIGIFTGLLLAIFLFAMITETDAKTTTATTCVISENEAGRYLNFL